ncbi:hypothetical protein PM082_000395 [Marasmius tenuissimus]|nr:hypothetical protein PM082_000395 [Marasmius tenuissimus]
MDLLVCHSHRWRTISLDFGVKASHLRALERLTRADLPLLETFHIASHALLVDADILPDSLMTLREDSTPFANLLPQLPSLRSLDLQYASPAVLNLVSTCLGLTQLTLSLRMPPTVVLRQIAPSCRALHTLTISSNLTAPPENDAVTALFPKEPPIEWPSLQELNLLLEGSGYYINTGGTMNTLRPVLKNTFDSILTPQLRRLFIQFARARPRLPPVENDVPAKFHCQLTPPHTSTTLRTRYSKCRGPVAMFAARSIVDYSRPLSTSSTSDISAASPCRRVGGITTFGMAIKASLVSQRPWSVT